MKNLSIAILGLGAMGSRMAMRLLEAGYALSVYNRTHAATEALVERGATAAATAREAARGCEVVLSCVRDDEAAAVVWLDPDTGALAGMGEGSIGIESSTITPACVARIAAAAGARGIPYLDAPVVGTRPQADAGALVHLVGGDPDAVAQVRPVLDVVGGAVHHVGPSGSGATMKLAVNALFALQVAAIAELSALAAKSGIDPDVTLEVLGALPVTSPAAKGAAALIRAGKHAPSFPIDLVEKDLGYAEAAAREARAEVPITAATRTVFARARASGDGGLNITGVARLYWG